MPERRLCRLPQRPQLSNHSSSTYLHNGCVATLIDRFNLTCGGGDQYRDTLQLNAGQISDLVAYLESP